MCYGAKNWTMSSNNLNQSNAAYKGAMLGLTLNNQRTDKWIGQTTIIADMSPKGQPS